MNIIYDVSYTQICTSKVLPVLFTHLTLIFLRLQVLPNPRSGKRRYIVRPARTNSRWQDLTARMAWRLASTHPPPATARHQLPLTAAILDYLSTTRPPCFFGKWSSIYAVCCSIVKCSVIGSVQTWIGCSVFNCYCHIRAVYYLHTLTALTEVNVVCP